MPVSLVHGLNTHLTAGAVLSNERPYPRYRYCLERRWGSGAFAMFVALNPSTADATKDDLTVRKCVGFARRWGYGGILIGNLYAFRATYPVELDRAEDPIGPDCDVWLQTMSMRSSVIIACWGSQRMATPERVRQVSELIGGPLWCLGTCADGSPRHPSRLAYKTLAVPLAM